MTTHDYYPKKLVEFTIMSIPKDKSVSQSECRNYRGILFNPSKSKLMYYNVSHDNLHVKLCNQDVHIVSKEIYLGNYISENIYDRAIKQTVCAFNAKSNQIISDFSMLDCFSLHKLHTTYCMSLYGCEI